MVIPLVTLMVVLSLVAEAMPSVRSSLGLSAVVATRAVTKGGL